MKISARRFHRLRIDPGDVSPSEREALTRAGVTDPLVQAFLAWRRSLLLAIVVFLVPLLTLETVALFAVGHLDPALKKVMTTYQGLTSVPLLAEVGFGVVAVLQLRRWTDWRGSRRLLALAWLVMFAAPFVIYLYPLRSLVIDALGDHAGEASSLGLAAISLVFALHAMTTLLPRAVALVPGIVRGALVTKHLFPGHPAPGWLVVAAAPICALLVYLTAIIPYQVTGSGWFVLGIAGVVTAEVFLVKAGLALARPLTRDQLGAGAVHRRNFLIAMGAGGLFLIVGVGSLASTFEIKAIVVVAAVLGVLVNLAITTLVATDGLLVGLGRARVLGPASGDTDRDLARFTPPA